MWAWNHRRWWVHGVFLCGHCADCTGNIFTVSNSTQQSLNNTADVVVMLMRAWNNHSDSLYCLNRSMGGVASQILLNNHSTIMPMWWWCWCGHETTTVRVFIVSIVLRLELHHCYDYMRCNNQRIDNTIMYWRLWFLLSWRRGRVHRRFWSSVMLANWIYVSGCKTCNGCGRGGHRLM